MCLDCLLTYDLSPCHQNQGGPRPPICHSGLSLRDLARRAQIPLPAAAASVMVLDFVQFGGPGRTRTGDPRDANAMLSQLSYRPRAALRWLGLGTRVSIRQATSVLQPACPAGCYLDLRWPCRCLACRCEGKATVGWESWLGPEPVKAREANLRRRFLVLSSTLTVRRRSLPPCSHLQPRPDHLTAIVMKSRRACPRIHIYQTVSRAVVRRAGGLTSPALGQPDGRLDLPGVWSWAA